jgi:peptidyl-prolyl cis-trans isomerase C
MARMGCLGLILLVLALTGCEKKKRGGTQLAKVGEATLTLEDVRRTFPAEFEQALPREQYLDFVKRWIDDEVIYQQAQKAALDKDTLVAHRIEDLRRKMLIEEFMAREGAAESVEPDDAALTQYYEVHREDFRRKTPEWRVLTLRVKSLREAMDLKPKLRGSDFLAQAAPHLLDALPENMESIPYRKSQELGPCLQTVVPITLPGQIAGPLSCPEGVVLVKVLDKAESGSLVSFNDVRDHISGILMMERKSKQREGTIAHYKEGALITFNLDKIPGRDTPLEESTPSGQMDADGPTAADASKGNRNTVDMEAYSAGEAPPPKPKSRSVLRPTPIAAPVNESVSPSNPSPANEPAGTQRSDATSAPATDTVPHATP